MSNQLTVIIPIYNRAHVLARTLDSIAASTVLPAELILVDNNSQDDSLRCCREWAARHSTDTFRVTVLEAQRPGASVARNVGLAACTTPYVYFFDSDDLFSDAFVADLSRSISAHPTADVFFVPVRQQVGRRSEVRAYQPSAAAWVHVLNSQFDTLSMVFRTDYLRNLGGWDEHLTVWDDWELGLRVALSEPRWLWLTEKAYHHVIVHSQSQTGTGFAATAAPILQAMRQALCEVQSAPSAGNNRDRCLTALYYRTCITEGKLIQEKAAAGIAAFAAFRHEAFPQRPPFQRLMGALLRTYTGWGGRGAWRIAMFIVRPTQLLVPASR